MAPARNLDFCKPATSSWGNYSGEFQVTTSSSSSCSFYSSSCCSSSPSSTSSWGNVNGLFQVDLTCSSYPDLPHLEAACRQDRGVGSPGLSGAQVEKVAWIWAIAFAFAVPQLASFLRCLRKFLFKFNEWPRLSVLVFVALMEALHTAGLAILCYLVLPHLDAVKGLLLTSALAIGDLQ